MLQSGSVLDYVLGDGMILGTWNTSSVAYFHPGALGSVRLTTGSLKQVLFADNYQPFGQDNGTPFAHGTYKYTGKPVSQTTGLYDEYQRWYDPSAGRFISTDLGRALW